MSREDDVVSPDRRRRAHVIPQEIERRNDEMEQLFLREGWTYDRIAKEYGITRARVHQVLKKRGADNVDASKTVRREQKAVDASSDLDRFDATIGPFVRRLLHAGVTADEIVARLSAVGSSVSEDEVRSFAQRHHLPVPHPGAPKFSAAILRLAMLAAAADQADLPVEESAAVLIESEDLTALRLVSNTAEEVKALSARAAVAKISAESLSLTKNEYEVWRGRWLVTYPKDDAVPWPPTSQTLRKRLGGGYWNDAVKNAGLAPHLRGRSRGALVYKATDEYVLAVSQFLADAENEQRSTSYDEYDRWAAGRPIPTGAGVRNYYGTWNAAKLAAVVFAGVRGSRQQGKRQLPADVLIDRFLQVSDRVILDAAETIPTEGHGASIILATKKAADELLGEMVTAFEGFRRQWIFEAIREDPLTFIEKLGADGSATKAEKRAWSALADTDLRATPESVIASTSLDRLLSSFAGDLRNGGGWLGVGPQSRLDRILQAESLRWRLIKSLRNVLEHESAESVGLLRTTFAELESAVDPAFFVNRAPDSPANIRRWLIAEVGEPAGYAPNRLSRARIGHLHAVMTRTAKAMRAKDPR
jgi:hypothetical protein